MLLILSLLDILAGVFLAVSLKGLVASLIGLIVLVKGLFSLAGSMSEKYFFDWMGWIDMITGVMLIFSLSVPMFWIIPIVKGVYSLVFSLN